MCLILTLTLTLTLTLILTLNLKLTLALTLALSLIRTLTLTLALFLTRMPSCLSHPNLTRHLITATSIFVTYARRLPPPQASQPRMATPPSRPQP